MFLKANSKTKGSKTVCWNKKIFWDSVSELYRFTENPQNEM